MSKNPLFRLFRVKEAKAIDATGSEGVQTSDEPSPPQDVTDIEQQQAPSNPTATGGSDTRIVLDGWSTSSIPNSNGGSVMEDTEAFPKTVYDAKSSIPRAEDSNAAPPAPVVPESITRKLIVVEDEETSSSPSDGLPVRNIGYDTPRYIRRLKHFPNESSPDKEEDTSIETKASCSSSLADSAFAFPADEQQPPPVRRVSILASETTNFTPQQDQESVSQYVTIYVKHSYSITCLHFLMAILCCIFALPYVDLSNPDAGLRLRTNPMADRGDGFLAAVQNMLPTDGFSLGVVGLTTPVQTITRERSLDGDTLTLYWFLDPSYPQDIFSLEYLQYMKEFEDRLFNLTTYQNQLCKLSDAGDCVPFHSAATALLATNQSNQSLPLQSRIDLLFEQDTFFFAYNYLDMNRTNVYTRTDIYIGSPLAGYLSPQDRPDEQSDKALAILHEEILPIINEKTFGSGKFQPPRLTYNQDAALAQAATAALVSDLSLAGLALGLIFACLFLHFGSLFLAVMALILILISFPITLFIYRLIFGIRLFGGMHVVGVYLILGIGVDDCFVFFDSFDQATRENPDRSPFYRMNLAYRSARYAMFATSFTTMLCFLSLLTSGIPILVYFGIFCGILVICNYVLVMTLFAGILLIWDEKFRTMCIHQNRPQTNASSSTDFPTPTSARQRMASTLSDWNARANKLNSTFTEKVFVFVAERFITRNVGKALIIISCTVLIVTLCVYATHLQPSKSLDSYWPIGHPFQIVEQVSEYPLHVLPSELTDKQTDYRYWVLRRSERQSNISIHEWSQGAISSGL